jgi:hypothetical protein
MKTPREVLLNRHRDIEPKLNRMWPAVAVCDRRRGAREVGAHRAPLQALCRELIWPCRRVWAGLACVWAMIAILNVASSEPATRMAGKAEPMSTEKMQALVEQHRMLAQLIGPLPEPERKRAPVLPGQRSERSLERAAA